MTYKLSRKSREDLHSIWLYTFENWSLEQADIYIRLIRTEIENLAERPARGREVVYASSKYRRSRVKSHFIYYRETSTSEIEVIRILHQKMDIENRLSDTL